MTLRSQNCKIINTPPPFFFLVYFLLIFLTNALLIRVKKKNYIPIILSLSGKYSFKNGAKGGGVLIILLIWEWSVISPKYGVASLVSPKEGGVSVIYPFYFILIVYIY
jgi:hypothetical protein